MKSPSEQHSSNAVQIDQICDDFEKQWQTNRAAQIQDYLEACPTFQRSLLLRKLIAVDVKYRARNDKVLTQADYELQFPKLMDAVSVAFAKLDDHTLELTQASTEKAGTHGTATPIPDRIDRYEIIKLLGSGGFGAVYLAHDPNLNRRVAIKHPRTEFAQRPDYVRNFLLEAEILAKLDHPNIVRVHDARRAEDGRCFLVSEWIQGTDLRQLMARQRLSWREIATLVAKVADALQHAHSLKLVHRDIKPANILIDASQQPHVADFGLALRDEAFGLEGRFAGTPAYMSPEQARGEGHLVDGRSDIYSLGVVLYELLCGERPFSAPTERELRERIEHLEPRPPRQLRSDIPIAMERICLKSLSTQATNRYTTALDLADDLRCFLKAHEQGEADAELPTTQPAKVIPKGLRSFGQMDADFFLRLLPGPRDRDGIPASIRFWKSRIEQRDPDRTFRIGVIYGPSGCGKSSMVKAGLLPLLPRFVQCVFIEANGVDDAQRLLRAIRKKCGITASELSLPETIAGLRRGTFHPHGGKTLLILDQFEQWLHARPNRANDELLAALRQSDGERVQCLLLVRDDFWMGITRFMRELDEPIAEGKNSAAVDRFDLKHARQVLLEFGRAFGRLPPDPEELTGEQQSFVNQAVVELARNESVIPVRLTLFAEMVKGQPWTSATLEQFGGAQGITLTFLEDTFSSETAPLENRAHQQAARSVLAALLPEGDISIKGYMRSHSELLAASGYGNRPEDFLALMRVLDNETRLLTPVEIDSEPPTRDSAADEQAARTWNEKYYHLTHDYLVQPLREWLTRKQRETSRGRAELLLEERSSLWNRKPEKRRLPSLREDLDVRLLTRRQNWSESQRKMMRASGIYYAVRGFAIALTVALLAWSSVEFLRQQRANELVSALKTAHVSQVPQIVEQLLQLPRQATPLVRQLYAASSPESREELHSQVALLPLDAELRVELIKLLGEQFRDDSAPEAHRMVIAIMLARYAADQPQIMAELLLEASPEQHELVIANMEESAVANILPIINEAALAPVPMNDDREEQNRQLNRRAKARALILLLDNDRFDWSVLSAAEDPTERTYVISRLSDLRVKPEELVTQLQTTEVADVRASLLQILGGMDRVELAADVQTAAMREFNQAFEHSDPAVHSSAESALRRWGAEEVIASRNSALVSKEPKGSRGWYHNLEGHTLVVFRGPITVQLGSPLDEPGRDSDETQVTRHIHRDFAIATKEVTKAQFERFYGDFRHLDNAFSTTPDSPLVGLTWHRAAQYCVWLSVKEGISADQLCYRPRKIERLRYLDALGRLHEMGEMEPYPDYLKRTGYRLPTEAEWEFACRVQTRTPYGWGFDSKMAKLFAWYIENSAGLNHPVGRLLPNDFGLFDIHGNVSEWIHDRYFKEQILEEKDDLEDLTPSDDETLRLVRGGASIDFTTTLRCANRRPANPATGVTFRLGFRVARTLGEKD